MKDKERKIKLAAKINLEAWLKKTIDYFKEIL